MLKGVLLDVDGTLLDTERLFMDGWLRAARELHYPLRYEQVLFFHGKGVHENGVTFRKWFGADADYESTRALRQNYVEERIAAEGVPTKPGLFVFLDYLREKGLKIALATGTVRQEAAPRWEKAGLLPYVDASVCGDEVTHNKPDPEIFLRAASLLGVPPQDCIVFEDSPAGLAAGRAAGCRTCMIPDMEPATEKLRETLADYVCDSLSAAAEMLEKEFFSGK